MDVEGSRTVQDVHRTVQDVHRTVQDVNRTVQDVHTQDTDKIFCRIAQIEISFIYQQKFKKSATRKLKCDFE